MPLGGSTILMFGNKRAGICDCQYHIRLKGHLEKLQYPNQAQFPPWNLHYSGEDRNTAPGGFAEVEFAGLRPRRPEINIVAFSAGDDTNFETIGATFYATIA